MALQPGRACGYDQHRPAASSRRRAPRGTLPDERGVIQVLAVDKERAAVEVCLQEGKTPGSQPRGATGHARGGECATVSHNVDTPLGSRRNYRPSEVGDRRRPNECGRCEPPSRGWRGWRARPTRRHVSGVSDISRIHGRRSKTWAGRVSGKPGLSQHGGKEAAGVYLRGGSASPAGIPQPDDRIHLHREVPARAFPGSLTSSAHLEESHESDRLPKIRRTGRP